MSTPLSWVTPRQVVAEMKKSGLRVDEAQRLTDLMERCAAGRLLSNDHKRLRDGVEELRLKGDRRIFRLYYARLDDQLVLLCLHFKIKKKQRDDRAIDLAAERLKRWRGGADL